MTTHDKDMDWEDSPVELTSTRDWELDYRGNVYAVAGPCPRCHARGQSGQTYVVGDPGAAGDGAGDGMEAPAGGGGGGFDPSVEVLVTCRCGSSHDEDETGCGASWVVPVKDLAEA